jgi:hypothetical protein
MAARTKSKVTPKYKTKYHVRNWPEYDRALAKRGDITVWFDEDVIETWTPLRTGRRGGQRRYSNLAILTALTLRVVFHLPLRQTEGFLNSILRLMDLHLTSPDHTTLSRRNRDVNVPRPNRVHDGPIHLIVDSTGLKILGDGEWHRHKHKTSTRRGWRKLHLGVDAEGFIVASQLTENGVDDASQVVNLRDQVEQEVATFTADGAYDKLKVYDALCCQRNGAIKIVIPPQKDAALSRARDRAAHLRNENVRTIRRLGRQRWRKESGYFQQGRAENTFFRYKRVFGGALRAIDFGSQRREALIGCNVLNRMAELGMPASYSIS